MCNSTTSASPPMQSTAKKWAEPGRLSTRLHRLTAWCIETASTLSSHSRCFPMSQRPMSARREGRLPHVGCSSLQKRTRRGPLSRSRASETSRTSHLGPHTLRCSLRPQGFCTNQRSCTKKPGHRLRRTACTPIDHSPLPLTLWRNRHTRSLLASCETSQPRTARTEQCDQHSRSTSPLRKRRTRGPPSAGLRQSPQFPWDTEHKSQ